MACPASAPPAASACRAAMLRGVPASLSRPPGPAQLGGAGAWIGLLLGLPGYDRIRDDRGIHPRPQPFAERVFNASVFPAMKADDGRDGAGLEEIGRHRQQALEIRQFAIDQDAQGLERAGRRMQLGARGPLEREIAGFADDLRQVLPVSYT